MRDFAILDRMAELEKMQADILKKNLAHDQALESQSQTIKNQSAEIERQKAGISRQKLKIKGLESDIEYYRSLLLKPMHEIAQNNKGFREQFDGQMEILASWMLSAKAFRELSFQLGAEKGLSRSEVLQLVKDMKTGVMDRLFESSNETNADDFMSKYVRR